MSPYTGEWFKTFLCFFWGGEHSSLLLPGLLTYFEATVQHFSHYTTRFYLFPNHYLKWYIENTVICHPILVNGLKHFYVFFGGEHSSPLLPGLLTYFEATVQHFSHYTTRFYLFPNHYLKWYIENTVICHPILVNGLKHFHGFWGTTNVFLLLVLSYISIFLLILFKKG